MDQTELWAVVIACCASALIVAAIAALLQRRSRLGTYERQRLLDLDRARTAAALRETAALLDTIIDESPIGFAYFDLDGRCQRINRALAEVNGVPPDECVGREARDVLPTLADTITPILEQVATARVPVRDIEVVGNASSRPGGAREWLAGFYPVLDSGGQLIGIGVAALEVTPLRRVDRRLRDIISTLQASFLPLALPEHADFELAVEYRAASGDTDIGGDFYDAALRPDGSIAVTIGDVCGHDIGAAVLTGVVRHTISAAAQHFGDPDEVLVWANQTVLDHAGDGRFVSVAHGSLHAGRADGSAELQLSLAGHPQPVLVPADGRTPHEIGVPGTLLGVHRAATTRATRVELAPGDQVVFYTDGLTDNSSPRLSSEDVAALVGECRSASAAETAQRLMSRYDNLDLRRNRDDVAVLVVHRRSPPTGSRLSGGADSAR